MSNLNFFVENDHDASMRLSGAVFKYKGSLAYVSSANSNEASAKVMDSGKFITIKTKDLDLSPVHIGNVNTPEGYLSVTRMPCRRVKQGLSSNNIHKRPMPWDVDMPELHSKEVFNAIMGIFPTYEEALDKVLTDGISVSFSKEWGLGESKGVVTLFYKNNPVGYLSDDEVVLYKHKHYLEEKLLEVLNG